MVKTYSCPDLSEVSLHEAMQALADPCRVEILRSLLRDPGREFACNEIELPVGKATASHHFETLRLAGLIQTRTQGNRCLSSVRRAEVESRFPGLLSLVEGE